MTATDYADSKFKGVWTFHKIAKDAFNAGIENAKPDNTKKLEAELKKTKAELKSLWDTLYDTEGCSNLLAGL